MDLLGAPIDCIHAEKCRFRTSGMWHYVFGQIVPIVVKDHSAFILRVKQSALWRIEISSPLTSLLSYP